MSTKEPTYGATFYAKLFNITERRVQQLAKEGIIPKVARGKYPLLGAVRGYITFLQERSLSPEVGDGDINSNRNRLIRAQAEAREMENEMMRRDVAPFGFVSFVLGKIASEVRGLHDALPMECGRQLNLTVQETEKISVMVAQVAGSVAQLGDRQWLESALDEFNRGAT